ncbi:MAG: hypothetical protein M1837_005294 [Sclerophora amabilis]|nr:MAG: hypothetical protein M1837_005294 [Sclerophora amabilis]
MSRRLLFSTQQRFDRRTILKAIYQPFQGLTKDSAEYNALAHSGTVWENYFKPQNIEPYRAAQEKLQTTLAEVDKLKEMVFSKPGQQWNETNRALVDEYAQQSTALELNPLRVGDSLLIGDKLRKDLFPTISNLQSMTPDALATLALPSPEALLPGKDGSQVAELRNHIVVSHYLTEVGLAHPGTAGVSLPQMKQLCRLMLAGTASEEAYSRGWGKRVALGDFRSAPIRVRSNPMRIFPYPQEVEACMKRFLRWRDDCHASSHLHPLIMATHLFLYFTHIHPFADGNGRVGRAMMADYLVRQGYVPPIFVALERADYLKMVSDAQDGNPSELCEAVASTQEEMLSRFRTR